MSLHHLTNQNCYRFTSFVVTAAVFVQLSLAEETFKIFTGDARAAVSETVTIPIIMQNSMEATAYSFSLVLPNEIDPTTVTFESSPDRKKSNVCFDNAVQSDGSIMVLCYSTDGMPFSGDDGKIATVSFDIPQTMNLSDYSLIVRDTEISESGLAHRTAENEASTLSIVASSSEYILEDGKVYDHDSDQRYDIITYSRIFGTSSLNKWQALYIPFSFDVAEFAEDFDIAEIFAICPTADTNNDGVVDAADNKKMIVSRKMSGETYANAPYLIRPKTTPINITATDCTLKAAVINTVVFMTTQSEYTVYGLYESFTAKPGDDNFYVSASGNLSFATTRNVNINPNRWYLHENPRSYIVGGDAAHSAPREMPIVVLGEDLDEETALQFIQADAIQSCAGADNVIYNLNGVRVDDSNSLPAGIYVKNGKTFMIR